MKAEYINPFVESTLAVLRAVLGERPIKGQLAIRPSVFTTHHCNVLTGVTGMVEGQLIYGMSLVTADRIASFMIGETIRSFDHLAASAIAELGNMISGNALTRLSDAGYSCDITPPAIMRGQKVRIDTLGIEALIMPITTRHGQIDLIAGLRERVGARISTEAVMTTAAVESRQDRLEAGVN